MLWPWFPIRHSHWRPSMRCSRRMRAGWSICDQWGWWGSGVRWDRRSPERRRGHWSWSLPCLKENQWCHGMETRYASLALCDDNPPVTGGFPSQRASDEELWPPERRRGHWSWLQPCLKEDQWRHDMEALYVSLALCEGNPPVTGGLSPVDSPHKGPVMRGLTTRRCRGYWSWSCLQTQERHQRIRNAARAWKCFPHYWLFVWGNHRALVESPRSGRRIGHCDWSLKERPQWDVWRGGYMFSERSEVTASRSQVIHEEDQHIRVTSHMSIMRHHDVHVNDMSIKSHSPATELFVEKNVQTNYQENVKAPRCWHLWEGWGSVTKGQRFVNRLHDLILSWTVLNTLFTMAR